MSIFTSGRWRELATSQLVLLVLLAVVNLMSIISQSIVGLAILESLFRVGVYCLGQFICLLLGRLLWASLNQTKCVILIDVLIILSYNLCAGLHFVTPSIIGSIWIFIALGLATALLHVFVLRWKRSSP
jgi:hypothetical protein